MAIQARETYPDMQTLLNMIMARVKMVSNVTLVAKCSHIKVTLFDIKEYTRTTDLLYVTFVEKNSLCAGSV
jgi:capsular polysaccharide biosynthesis protein